MRLLQFWLRLTAAACLLWHATAFMAEMESLRAKADQLDAALTLIARGRHLRALPGGRRPA